jgi:isoquinoline 1-oxidoreductase
MVREQHDDVATTLDPAADFTEVERYELRESPRYRFSANRREFVQVLGAGILVAVAARPSSGQQRRQRGGGRGRSGGNGAERFHIGKDGIVTVLTSKVEAGQGARTQITQAAAEELRMPLERVQLLMADTTLCPDDGGTAGSRTTPATIPTIRKSCAALREKLIDIAATKFQVDRAKIEFRGGKLSAQEPNREITLGELAADEKLASLLKLPYKGEAAVHKVDEWAVLGKPTAKTTGRAVVTGEQKYPSDIVRPGMMYGRVLRPPTIGATLKSLDATAGSIEGVTIVHDGNLAGCVAANSFLATEALATLAKAAVWEGGKREPSSEALFEHFKKHAAGNGGGRARENRWGDSAKTLAAAKTKIDAAYTVPYIQHAPMEPRAAVAEWSDGKLTVWTGSQQPSRVQSDLAEAFHLSPDKVRVIVPDMGGGFGGKHSGEAAVEAARLAKAAGKPVSLRWTREEEFTSAYFRPAGLIEVQAALDDRGDLAAWDFANYNSGGSAIETPYRAAAGRTRFVATDSPLRQGSYRALASTANTFARESAMDELALLAKCDPLEFRLAHLPAGRLKDVLSAVAKRFNWDARSKAAKTPRGVGIACGTEKGSYVAACAEVEMVDGKAKVLSLCQAFECGAIQNPLNLRAQVLGAMVMGLGGALTEAIAFKDGHITTASFSDYRVPRMSDVPAIEVELVDRKDLPSVGAGETPIIAVAPAIANAIAHAGGGRRRALPLNRIS